ISPIAKGGTTLTLSVSDWSNSWPPDEQRGTASAGRLSSFCAENDTIRAAAKPAKSYPQIQRCGPKCAAKSKQHENQKHSRARGASGDCHARRSVIHQHQRARG